MSGKGKTMTSTAGVRCDMYTDCAEPVTHIGDKGYAYCATHGPSRRESGYERVRRMRPWEVRWLREGRVLPSYKPGPDPEG